MTCCFRLLACLFRLALLDQLEQQSISPSGVNTILPTVQEQQSSLLPQSQAPQNSTPQIPQLPLLPAQSGQAGRAPSPAQQPQGQPQVQLQHQSHFQQPQQPAIQLQIHQRQNSGASVASQPGQTPHQQTTPASMQGSPAKPAANPVWSGSIQWTFVDPNKNKKVLAFYVDAIPLRANAAVEL